KTQANKSEKYINSMEIYKHALKKINHLPKEEQQKVIASQKDFLQPTPPTQEELLEETKNTQNETVGFTLKTVDTLLTDINKELKNTSDNSYTAILSHVKDCAITIDNVVKERINLETDKELHEIRKKQGDFFKKLGVRYLPFKQSSDPLKGQISIDNDKKKFEGVCAGHVMQWVKEIEGAGKASKLSRLDERTLFFHTNQHQPTTWTGKYNPLSNLASFRMDIDQLIDKIKPDEIYQFSMRFNKTNSGHRMGIRRIPNSNDIEFFDPNFGTVVFNEINDFKKWLTAYIAETYYPDMEKGGEFVLRKGFQPSDAKASIPTLTGGEVKDSKESMLSDYEKSVAKVLKKLNPKPKDDSLIKFHMAVGTNDLKTVQSMLKEGVNPNSIYGFVTPLGLAIANSNVEIIKELLKYEADINQKSLGQMPLAIAESMKNEEVKNLIQGHQSFYRGIEESKKGNYIQAIECYEKAVAAGKIEAKTHLAELCYQQGLEKDQNKNPTEAIPLYQKAVAAGHLKAKTNLAFHYLTDSKVKNIPEAFKLFSEAANGGHARAQFNLAMMYEKGDGVEKNAGKAIEWYKKAKENNYSPELAEKQINKLQSSMTQVATNSTSIVMSKMLNGHPYNKPLPPLPSKPLTNNKPLPPVPPKPPLTKLLPPKQDDAPLEEDKNQESHSKPRP
ncbi:MAG: hypothetical protein EPO11_01305, partial [Gammaproteobacteria bacterium]